MFTAISFVLCSLAVGAPPGVLPIANSRIDHALTAVANSGQTVLTGRELQAEITFLNGSSGKAKIFLLFDSATKIFFAETGWQKGTFPQSNMVDWAGSTRRFLPTPERLIVLRKMREGFSITESTDRASDINDAEKKALAWNNEHLGALAARKLGAKESGYLHEEFWIPRGNYPPGFFSSPYDPRPFVAVRLVEVIRQDDLTFHIVLESMDTRKQVKMTIFRRTPRDTQDPHPKWGWKGFMPVK